MPNALTPKTVTIRSNKNLVPSLEATSMWKAVYDFRIWVRVVSFSTYFYPTGLPTYTYIHVHMYVHMYLWVIESKMATSSEFLSTKMNIEHEPRHKRQRRWAFYDLTIEMKDFSIFSNDKDEDDWPSSYRFPFSKCPTQHFFRKFWKALVYDISAELWLKKTLHLCHVKFFSFTVPVPLLLYYREYDSSPCTSPIARVARLGEFSPIGWLFTLGSFLQIT
jgi:hypothetical protein